MQLNPVAMGPGSRSLVARLAGTTVSLTPLPAAPPLARCPPPWRGACRGAATGRNGARGAGSAISRRHRLGQSRSGANIARVAVQEGMRNGAVEQRENLTSALFCIRMPGQHLDEPRLDGFLVRGGCEPGGMPGLACKFRRNALERTAPPSLLFGAISDAVEKFGDPLRLRACRLIEQAA